MRPLRRPRSCAAGGRSASARASRVGSSPRRMHSRATLATDAPASLATASRAAYPPPDGTATRRSKRSRSEHSPPSNGIGASDCTAGRHRRARIAAYLDDAIRGNTRRAYRSGWERWHRLGHHPGRGPGDAGRSGGSPRISPSGPSRPRRRRCAGIAPRSPQPTARPGPSIRAPMRGCARWRRAGQAARKGPARCL